MAIKELKLFHITKSKNPVSFNPNNYTKMKWNTRTLMIVLVVFSLSCKIEQASELPLQEETKYFLSEIRPVFFEHLNFNSEQQRKEIAPFLVDFTKTYQKLENEYEEGKFKSTQDLDNMRIASMYYSFYITAIVRAYLDNFIKFEDIKGDRKVFFSNLSPENSAFKKEELKAMMDKSVQVAKLAVYVNGFNDKTLGTLNVAKQIQGRVNNDNHFNIPSNQNDVINYITSNIKNYDYFSEWNAFMSQLSMTNYEDSLNTFKNERMNLVLANLNKRDIPYLDNKYQAIIAPIYKFDLNLKKVDWYLQKDKINSSDLQEVKDYISKMENISQDIIQNRAIVLNKWTFKETFYQRMSKLEEVKNYFNRLENENINSKKPNLSPFFSAKDYLQAYQCYNCHKTFE
jgi:hypothetical protein